MDAKKTVVYICSPYRGDVDANTEKARRYCRYAADRGYVPIAPHLLLPQFVDEETEREAAIESDLAILERCDELWVCGEDITDGMAAEIASASDRNMKTRFVKEEDIPCLRSGKE